MGGGLWPTPGGDGLAVGVEAGKEMTGRASGPHKGHK